MKQQRTPLPVHEAARRLGVSTATIYRMVSDRRLKPMKFCGRNWFEPEELDEIAAQRQKT